ncbi:MAG: HD domain-containing protein [Patescibacteria group bacterium]|nr:HD domain-containing protein [Patescibacteria group bacterium]
MPHRIEEGLVRIVQGLQDEQRWKNIPKLHLENVSAHTIKLGIVIQLAKAMIKKYDPDVKFNGEIVSDLGTIHDFGEAMDGFGDIQEPDKTEADERLEREKFLEAIIFLPADFQEKLLLIYDIQKENCMESRIFRACELFVRLFYCLREINDGNKQFWIPFWMENEKIQPFLKEFNGLRIMYIPIQEFVNLIRSQTQNAP